MNQRQIQKFLSTETAPCGIFVGFPHVCNPFTPKGPQHQTSTKVLSTLISTTKKQKQKQNKQEAVGSLYSCPN